MIYTLLAALLTSNKFTQAAQTDEYDYVIIGSGPGGGSLA
jgi:hypothetical protein